MITTPTVLSPLETKTAQAQARAHLSRRLEHREAFRRVTEEEGVVEARHHVPAPLGDLEHLPELVRVPREQVEEGEALEVLGALVRHLHHLLCFFFGFTRKGTERIFFFVTPRSTVLTTSRGELCFVLGFRFVVTYK